MEMFRAQENSRAADGTVPLIFITHVTRENNVTKAVQMISECEEVAKVAAVIRVVS